MTIDIRTVALVVLAASLANSVQAFEAVRNSSDVVVSASRIVLPAQEIGVAATVMPKEIFDAEGKIRPDLVDEVFAKMDKNSSGTISRKEIESSALENMPKGTKHKDTKAEVAGKLGLDALDFDKSGDITRAELLKAAEDVAAIMNSR